MQIALARTTSPELAGLALALGAFVTPRAPSRRDAVGPVNRNGHAATVGRIVDLIARAGRGLRRSRTARLTLADEARLRDGDAMQLGAVGLAIATTGTTEEWRTFLLRHFRERYDLMLVLGASETSVQ